MKDIIYFIIHLILCTVVMAAVVIGLATCVANDEKKDWNNGYCECGGHWVYEQAVGHAYGTSYLYKCDECGKTIDIWKYRVAEVQNDPN